MDINDLISKGYFPEEIPPPFVTEDLKDVISEVVKNIANYPLLKTKSTSKVLPFSIPKSKAYRRNIGLPNPLAFINLANTIVDNWNDIIDFTSKSGFSLSPLTVSLNSRALTQPSFENITKQRILRSTSFKYVLKIDVQRFYGSIYTHSIPWALHTKTLSKVKRKRTDLLGNALDEDVRKMQDGQTMGIPIGPDTSRIISEIIVSYIDIELKKQIPTLKGLRVVDDYSFYFKKLGDLESARAIILKLLKDFELDLNQAKEKIIELPELIESEWYNRLRDFKFRNDPELQNKDLIAYFDLSYYYTSKYAEDPILPYSLSKISATIFYKENWQILESYLLKSLAVEPKVLPYVVKLFISHKDEGYSLSFDIIQEVLEDFINYHLNLDNHFEISWSLWLFKQLEIKLSESVAKELSKNNNSTVILSALDLFNSGFIPSGLETKEWKKLLVAESLYSENWLVAYEAVVKGWLTPATDYISKDAFFNLLKDSGVRFYKENNNLDLSSIKVTSEDISLMKIINREDEQDPYDDYSDYADVDAFIESIAQRDDHFTDD